MELITAPAFTAPTSSTPSCGSSLGIGPFFGDNRRRKRALVPNLGTLGIEGLDLKDDTGQSQCWERFLKITKALKSVLTILPKSGWLEEHFIAVNRGEVLYKVSLDFIANSGRLHSKGHPG